MQKMREWFLCRPQDMWPVCGCVDMSAVPFSRPSAASSSWGDGLSLQGSLGTLRNVGEMDWERLLLLLWLLPAAVPRGVCVSMLRELALRWQRGGGARCPSGASWGWCSDHTQQNTESKLQLYTLSVLGTQIMEVCLQHHVRFSIMAHSQ